MIEGVNARYSAKWYEIDEMGLIFFSWKGERRYIDTARRRA